ncbi:MAG: NDP-sugar synthase [Acidimicrobiales bacterium]
MSAPRGPALVVLAAGLGSRFGGAKQLAAVGPGGEVILDYTMVDARQAGFGEVVLIIRHDITELVTDHLRAIHGETIPYRLVFQDDLGPVRAKPWGTGHAVLAARDAVSGPFGVVNADDFYGAGALQSLADALASGGPADRHHLIAYRLDQTLSPAGPVSRGVCEVEGTTLRSIVEHYGIVRTGDGQIRAADAHGQAGTGHALAPDSAVSMNLWGLQPSALEELATAWATFSNHAEPTAELQLPTVLDAAVSAGRATVQVTRTDAAWMGVTYPDDLAAVRARVAELVRSGRYPTPLSSGTPAR